MNETEFAKMVETHSRQQLVAEIRRMAKRLADGAAKLEQHAKEAEAEVKPHDVVDQAVWAMNEVENVIRNLNFSNVARQIVAYTADTTTVPAN